jgi:hypothetical protein
LLPPRGRGEDSFTTLNFGIEVEGGNGFGIRVLMRIKYGNFLTGHYSGLGRFSGKKIATRKGDMRERRADDSDYRFISRRNFRL